MQGDKAVFWTWTLHVHHQPAWSHIIFAMDLFIETNTRLWLTQWKKLQKERESVCEEEGKAGTKHLSPYWGQRHTTCTEVSLLGAQAEMSQNTWMWLLCVFLTPRMFLPRKVFLCPQEEGFSGSSCCDSPSPHTCPYLQRCLLRWYSLPDLL